MSERQGGESSEAQPPQLLVEGSVLQQCHPRTTPASAKLQFTATDTATTIERGQPLLLLAIVRSVTRACTARLAPLPSTSLVQTGMHRRHCNGADLHWLLAWPPATASRCWPPARAGCCGPLRAAAAAAGQHQHHHAAGAGRWRLQLCSCWPPGTTA